MLVLASACACDGPRAPHGSVRPHPVPASAAGADPRTCAAHAARRRADRRAPTHARRAAEPPPAAATRSPRRRPAEVVDKQAARTTEHRLAAEAACAAHEPELRLGDDVLVAREASSIRRTLKALGYEVEPAPWGKTIGKIRVHNEDVFAEKNWLRFFNLFHVTTKPTRRFAASSRSTKGRSGTTS